MSQAALTESYLSNFPSVIGHERSAETQDESRKVQRCDKYGSHKKDCMRRFRDLQVGADPPDGPLQPDASELGEVGSHFQAWIRETLSSWDQHKGNRPISSR